MSRVRGRHALATPAALVLAAFPFAMLLAGVILVPDARDASLGL
jgi:hypothetical protein